MSVSQQDILVQGRIVMGHPVKRQTMTDDKGNKLFNDDGTTKTQHFFVLAVPKGAEQDWKQTEWGQKVLQVASNGYRNGEVNRPDFSWKVEDGDSQIPNKKGRKNCDTEGHPGHWIIKCTTQLHCPCFPYNKYSPFDAITDENAVKCGDYYMISIECADNTNKGAPAKTPGVYMNPKASVFIRSGVEIVGAGSVDAQQLFGGVVIEGAEQPMMSAPQSQPLQAQHAPVAQAAPTPQASATPAPSVQPAHDLVQPQTPGNAEAPPVLAPEPVEESYIVNGKPYTRSQLLAMPGWTEAHLAGLQKA